MMLNREKSPLSDIMRNAHGLGGATCEGARCPPDTEIIQEIPSLTAQLASHRGPTLQEARDPSIRSARPFSGQPDRQGMAGGWAERRYLPLAR